MRGATRFPVPDVVLRRAQSEGQPGLDWLASLDRIVASLEADWGLTIGQALPGGTAAFVAVATEAAGEQFVIKIPTPESQIGRNETAVLTAADGKGYVRLIRHDAARGAILLERLGPSLDLLERPYRDKIDIMCAILLQAWMRSPAEAPYVTGADKANSLAMAMIRLNHTLGQPCSQTVVDRALMYCRDRAAAWRPELAVLAHGDPHPANILADPVREGQYKLIDPDGLLIEPAYDLGVLLRAWNDGISGRHAHDIARSHARHLTTRTQVPAEAIWQWGFIERVSTGLHLLEIGSTANGRELLAVAELLTNA